MWETATPLTMPLISRLGAFHDELHRTPRHQPRSPRKLNPGQRLQDRALPARLVAHHSNLAKDKNQQATTASQRGGVTQADL